MGATGYIQFFIIYGCNIHVYLLYGCNIHVHLHVPDLHLGAGMNESSTHKKRIKRLFLTCSGSADFSSMIWQDIFQDVWHMDVSFPDDGLSSTVVVHVAIHNAHDSLAVGRGVK